MHAHYTTHAVGQPETLDYRLFFGELFFSVREALFVPRGALGARARQHTPPSTTSLTSPPPSLQ